MWLAVDIILGDMPRAYTYALDACTLTRAVHLFGQMDAQEARNETQQELGGLSRSWPMHIPD